MSDEPVEGSRPSTPTVGSPYLVPLAILAGFAMVATAIYLGLSARAPVAGRGDPPEPAADLSLPEAERGPWVVTSTAAPSAAPASGPRGTASPPAKVHTRSAFNTQWMKVRAEVNRVCQPTTQVQAKERSWHIELPLTLQIGADGRITSVRRFAKMRDTADDGTFRAAATRDAGEASLTQCYANQLAERIRFEPATAPGELQVWVRILSTVE